MDNFDGILGIKRELARFWTACGNNGCRSYRSTLSRAETLRLLMEMAAIRFVSKDGRTLQHRSGSGHLGRAHGDCFACGGKATGRHRILKLSNGGTNSKGNLVLLCDDCRATVERGPNAKLAAEIAQAKRKTDWTQPGTAFTRLIAEEQRIANGTKPIFKRNPAEVTALRSLSHAEYLKTDDWQRMQSKVLGWRGNRCDVCCRRQSDKVPLDVYHKTHDRVGRERMIDLQVLCRDCHDVAHHESDALSEEYRAIVCASH